MLREYLERQTLFSILDLDDADDEDGSKDNDDDKQRSAKVHSQSVCSHLTLSKSHGSLSLSHPPSLPPLYPDPLRFSMATSD